MSNSLFHTIRLGADGTWPYAFTDVQTQTDLHGTHIFRINGVECGIACTTNQGGDLHVCVENGIALQ